MSMTRDTLRVDWKSEKDRDMHYTRAKLTPVMAKYLRALLLGNTSNLQSRTKEALRWRGLVDENQQLTEQGRVLALMRVSLKEQCRNLNLPLEEWQVSSTEHPEDKVKRILAEDGCRAHFVENTFGLFIDYVMGKSLVETAQGLERRIYTLNPPYDPELFFLVKQSLEQYFEQLNDNHCQESISICAPFLRELIMDETPIQMCMLFDDMYRSLGIEKVKSLLRMYFSNPLAYNYRGWPDLFVADEAGAYCIEVKTTDKLNLNQLVTIPDLVSRAGVPVKVVRLNLLRHEVSVYRGGIKPGPLYQ